MRRSLWKRQSVVCQIANCVHPASQSRDPADPLPSKAGRSLIRHTVPSSRRSVSYSKLISYQRLKFKFFMNIRHASAICFTLAIDFSFFFFTRAYIYIYADGIIELEPAPRGAEWFGSTHCRWWRWLSLTQRLLHLLQSSIASPSGGCIGLSIRLQRSEWEIVGREDFIIFMRRFMCGAFLSNPQHVEFIFSIIYYPLHTRSSPTWEAGNDSLTSAIDGGTAAESFTKRIINLSCWRSIWPVSFYPTVFM